MVGVTIDVGARPMRADALRNREALVSAARALLTTRGSEASMEEIAAAAGVGVGTLYRHFPRRLDLVEAVYREDVEALVALAAQVIDELPPWEALVAWLEGFLVYAHTKRTFLTELHEVVEKQPDLGIASREKIRAAVSLVLSRAQSAGVARDDVDGADVMQLVGGMCMARNGTIEQNERLLMLVLDGIRSG